MTEERSYPPGPHGLHARQLIKAALRLPAHTFVEVEYDTDRYITAIRLDGSTIALERWQTLRAIGLRMRETPRSSPHESGEMARVAVEDMAEIEDAKRR